MNTGASRGVGDFIVITNKKRVLTHEFVHAYDPYACDEYSVKLWDETNEKYKEQRGGTSGCKNPFAECCRNTESACGTGFGGILGFLIEGYSCYGSPTIGNKWSVMGTSSFIEAIDKNKANMKIAIPQGLDRPLGAIC